MALLMADSFSSRGASEFVMRHSIITSTSISHEETGRRREKGRTRVALVNAARELIAAGMLDGRASRGRRGPRAHGLPLLSEPAPTCWSPLIRQIERRRRWAGPSEDVGARLDRVVDALTRMFIANEPQLWNHAAVSLGIKTASTVSACCFDRAGRSAGSTRRCGRSREALQRRKCAAVYVVRRAVGIEALVWLCDVGGLSRKEAVELMRGHPEDFSRSALDEQSIKKKPNADLTYAAGCRASSSDPRSFRSCAALV